MQGKERNLKPKQFILSTKKSWILCTLRLTCSPDVLVSFNKMFAKLSRNQITVKQNFHWIWIVMKESKSLSWIGSRIQLQLVINGTFKNTISMKLNLQYISFQEYISKWHLQHFNHFCLEFLTPQTVTRTQSSLTWWRIQIEGCLHLSCLNV